MTTNDLEQGIVRVISDAANILIGAQVHSNAQWTNRIFSDLTRLAYNLKLAVWSKPNEVDDTINEWLYDFVIAEGRTPVDIDRVWVALESEWSPDFKEIKYDFYKLIQSRSMLRVMIFQSSDVEGTIDALVKIACLSEVSVPGDRYLFAGCSNDDGFLFRPYTKG